MSTSPALKEPTVIAAALQLDLFGSLPVNPAGPATVIPFAKKAVVELVESAVEQEVRNLRNFRYASELDQVGSNEAKADANLTAIKTLIKVEAEDRLATAEEMSLMAKFTGWGGLPQVFDEADTCKMPVHRDELKSLLSAEDYDSARASVLNSHYTEPEVIKFMWAAVEKLGFKGGKILDPAFGTGLYFGCMPKAISENSTLHGVELDQVTARFGKTLFPDVNLIQSGFEATTYPANYFDLAITNVPFGNYRVSDRKFDRLKLSIHDYYFAKALEHVRPGGIVAFLTSSYTMESNHHRLQKYLSMTADLVGAVRLPNNAFMRLGNAAVMTDIVFLRKRFANETSNGVEWNESHAMPPSACTNFYSKVYANLYYAMNPHMIAGQLYNGVDRYSHDSVQCKLEGSLSDSLSAILGHLPSAVYKPRAIVEKTPEAPESCVPAPDYVKPGGYAVINSILMTNDNGVMVNVEDQLNKKAIVRIKGIIEVRNKLREVLRSDLEGLDSSALRKELNSVYDAFVKEHGYLWDTANRRAFKDDPDFPLMLSIELFDEDEGTAQKADIFKFKTISKWALATEADNLTEALAISLNKSGRIDVDHIVSLTGMTKDAIESQFVEDDIAYVDPAKGDTWVMKDEYLSGNVRNKLVYAKTALHTDVAFKRNVEALSDVVPRDLLPEEIRVKLGSPWVPTEVIEAFGNMLFTSTDGVEVSFSPTIATWAVRGNWSVEQSIANSQEVGTPRRSGLLLLDDALNQKMPSIYDYDISNKAILNEVETVAAREKLHNIREKFKEWVWSDEDRAEKLARIYNDTYNSIVDRVYDGSHLTLPGMNPALELRSNQKNGIWRALVSEWNTLYAHAVGAGKTMTMIGAGYEAKRMGLANKPVFVVPNHMLLQFSAEFLRMYPAASILAASKDDLVGDKRKVLLSRIATGNWDGIIITLSSFEKLPLSNQRIKDYIESEKDKVELAILEAKSESGSNSTRLVKQLESSKKRLVTRLESMLNQNAKDDTLFFEDLGIDWLALDEADCVKNCYFTTKMPRIAGLPQTSSLRAFDMMMKTQAIMDYRGDGKGIIFATATPISNSIAEMYHMQMYLQRGMLEELDLATFDNWAANFAETVTAVEVAPDGSGYRVNTRFAKFVNVPELIGLFKMVADIQTKDMLKLPVPKLLNGKHTVISVPATEKLKEYVASLVERSERVKNRSVSPNVDNMLKITTDGRMAALDIRLVDSLAEEEEQSKAEAAADNIYRIYSEGTDQKLTQLVFCDLSTPNSEGRFSVYDALRDKLLARGIAADELAFIHDYDSDAQKAKLFKRMNEGKVRVLFGSTSKCGFGTNVQRLLKAVHCLDAPWRPRDVEQRDGRIERQGNLNEEIAIYRYVKEGSFDAYSWQTLESKARFIAQIMSGEGVGRSIEDVETAALSYAEVKAIASGNPLILEKAGVDADVLKLTILKKAYQKRLNEFRSAIRSNASEQILTSKRIENIKLDIQVRDTYSRLGAKFSIKIQGRDIRDEETADQALDLAIKAVKKTKTGTTHEIGMYRGFKLIMEKSETRKGYELYLEGKALHTTSLSLKGGVEQLVAIVARLDENLAAAHSRSSFLVKQNDELQSAMTKPFEQSAQLEELEKRQYDLEVALGIVTDDVSAAAINSEA